MEQIASENNDKRLMNYRPLFEIAVGLIIGIAVCGELSVNGVYVLTAVLLIGIAVFILIVRKNRSVLFLGAILLGVMLAFTAMPDDIASRDYRIDGIVCDIVKGADEEAELTLLRAKLDGKELKKKLLLCTDDVSGITIGDEVIAYGNAGIPDKEQQGTYSAYRTYLSRGIGAVAYANTVQRISSDNLPIKKFFFGIRSKIVDKAREIFDTDGALIARMMVGNTAALSKERTDIYRVTGTAHILSISGFHMSVIVMFAGLLLSRSKRWVRAIAIGVLMLLYCSVAVYTAGIVRSSIMMFCHVVSMGMERRNDSLCALSLAAIVILCVNPYQLYSIGFQFSFAACFGILTLNKPVERCMERHKIPVSLGLATTVSASLTTMMLQMHYFGTFSTYLLLANLVAIPAFSLILVLSLVITLLGFILPSIAVLLATIPRAVLFVTEKYLGALSSLPYSMPEFNTPPAVVCVFPLVAAFIASKYMMMPARQKLKFIALTALLFTASVFVSIM